MAQKDRLTRRMLGVLAARLPEARLDQVNDPRGLRGRRWPLFILLRAVLVAMVAGCKSLTLAEALTAEMSMPLRKRLGIARRIPDTTLRDVLCALDPAELRGPMHALVRAAHRRKALEPDKLPFGVVALDGKSTALPSCDDDFAQRQSHGDGGLIGVVRTTTCTLISSRAMPCIDAIPIPAATNEMGHFEASVRSLAQAYASIDLFRMISYDAGACSEHNAGVVRELGLHYLLGLKSTQPTLLAEAQRLLAALPWHRADASSEDTLGGARTVLRHVYVTEQMHGFGDWKHLRTVLRVESETRDSNGQRLSHDNRYFVSSLPAFRLTAAQWLLVVRLHWGVENNCHHTLDDAFEEDERPWIKSDPRGMVVIALLRRMAYNLLTLFRSVTQRSDERRATPWRDLLRWFYNAILCATDADLYALRPRPLANNTPP
jgi:DDE_Tnp_1-associated/Transposase DDE domain